MKKTVGVGLNHYLSKFRKSCLLPPLAKPCGGAGAAPTQTLHIRGVGADTVGIRCKCGGMDLICPRTTRSAGANNTDEIRLIPLRR